MFDALIQNAVPILLLIVLSFIFTGTGLLFLKLIRVAIPSEGEKVFFAFGIGTSLIGYAVFTLAVLHVLTPAALVALLALAFAAAVSGWRWAGAWHIPRSFPPQGLVERIAAFLLAVLLAAALLLALTPETARDALIYHLAVPKMYLKHHEFYFVPGNVFANYPFHTELLYLLALYLHGDILAKLVNFSFLPVILLGIRQFALHHMARNAFPYLSMLIFLTIPSIFVNAHMAYNDFAVVLYTMSALFAFITWRERQERGWILMCALFSGMALASKYTTLLIPSLGVLGILMAHRDSEKGSEVIRDLALFIVVMALFGAPFYIKNWIMTGNPFYPFLYGMFGGKGWSPEQARLYDGLVMLMGMGRSAVDYLLLPWNVSVHARMDSSAFDGVIGPVFLLIIPFLAGIRSKEPSMKIIMAYCSLLFLFWASASQQIRYLFPIFPFLALMVGAILTSYRDNRGMAAFLAAMLGGSLLFNATHIVKDFMNISPLGFILARESRDAYLNRSLSAYRMYRFVSTSLPPDAKVYLIYMKNWTFLCDRECYADAMFEHYTLQKILAASATADDVYRRLKDMGFTHLMFDVHYVTGEKSMLSPEQKGLFSAFQQKYLTLVKNDGSYYLFRM